LSHHEGLADRVREVLARWRPLEERPMAGGLAFVVRGRLACAVLGDDLVVRMGADDVAEALTRPGARMVDVEGRSMPGMLFVGKSGTRTRSRLERWIRDAVAYSGTLPPPRT
jgi:hypothetical protein